MFLLFTRPCVFLRQRSTERWLPSVQPISARYAYSLIMYSMECGVITIKPNYQNDWWSSPEYPSLKLTMGYMRDQRL